jgi:superfamily I DNA/RNA helicase
MKSTWWRVVKELDRQQQQFVALPSNGRYLLQGPPGSGKTNLLLLRAQYIAGTRDKNVLIITYTNDLADFIRTGISSKGIIESDQVQTFHSWAMRHVRAHLGSLPVDVSHGFDGDTRLALAKALGEANQKLASTKLYDAIFVDEAQDLSVEELKHLLALSEKVTVCGDRRQGIYGKDGLNVGAQLGLTPYTLNAHYRIGHRIAQVADRLIPPESPTESLEGTSNYSVKLMGKSSADMHVCTDRDEQFEKILSFLDVQLDAFKDELIGILVGKADTVAELRGRFNGSRHAGKVTIHDGDKDALGFSSPAPIHVMTIHRSKGAEFRAVHMYGVEELKIWGLNNRELGYTAITRAKTALNAFRSGPTNKPLESAFAEPKLIGLDDILDGDAGE